MAAARAALSRVRRDDAMQFSITDPREATRALAYFNHFHDGFVAGLTLRVATRSGDEFMWGEPVRYDAELAIQHRNYGAAAAGGAFCLITLRLLDLTRVHVSDVVGVDNMLQGCEIEVDAAGQIHVALDGQMKFSCRVLNIEEAGGLGAAPPSGGP